MSNATLSVNETIAGLAAIHDLASLWSFILSFGAVSDWLKLVVLGGLIETIRRFVSIGWNRFINSFFLTAEIDQYDPAYNWMLLWLSKQPAWNKARTIEINARKKGIASSTFEEPEEFTHDDVAKKVDPVSYLPAYNVKINIWFNHTWIQIFRQRKELGTGWNSVNNDVINIRMLTRSHKALSRLFRAAQGSYQVAGEDRIDLFTADAQNQWDLMSTRSRRPLSSVILEPKIKKRLMRDITDFLRSERWYAERGIPWRRGYLLHGNPGSGKTSIVHALAGELGLDIYIFSLAKKNLDDGELNNLIGRLPARSIALMEDIDVAFHRGITRGSALPNGANQSPQGPTPNSPPGQIGDAQPVSTGITLSGLLSAIDGVAAQEGRILFATTNNYRALDPALSRPGRFDVHVEFKLASKHQASELFRSFYPANKVEKTEEDEEVGTGRTTPTVTESETLIDFGDDEKMEVFGDEEDNIPDSYFLLTDSQVRELADRFASKIPEYELSMAALQGFLMQYKTRPHLAVEECEEWVKEEKRRVKGEEADQQGKKNNPESKPLQVLEEKKESASIRAEPPTTLDNEKGIQTVA